MKSIAGGIWRLILNAVFPLKCICCRSFYHAQSGSRVEIQAPVSPSTALASQDTASVFDRLLAPYLCAECRRAMRPITGPLCTACGVPFASRQTPSHVCGDCLKSPPRFDIARAVGIYQAALKEAIHQFKYRGNIGIGRALGQAMFGAFGQHWQDREIDAIVPVPLHPRRLRRRGFNQAHILVKQWPALARKVYPSAARIPVEHRLLHRTRWTEPQVGLSPYQRRRNIRGAFEAGRPSGGIKDKHLLLVDDVYTTGATISECARTLKRAGAARVDVLTLARAL